MSLMIWITMIFFRCVSVDHPSDSELLVHLHETFLKFKKKFQLFCLLKGQSSSEIVTGGFDEKSVRI